MSGRRCGPAVPPKPRRGGGGGAGGGGAAPPLVPTSCTVRAAREPSYSSRLPLYSNERVYGNVCPPSPVSSSYSELRRAAEPDSLYEPICPGGGGGGGSVSGGRGGEADVDALTELLVRSMDARGDDPLAYGPCASCGERVLGEAEGCTAMDRVYHARCFVCCRCGLNLQGKPFYALDGKPHCEDDYLDTLEKCSVCTRPILDRILRATGKPYHPACFACVVCGQSLDGIPFTVDATNRIHCIEDFHKKFAPRCCVCRRPIMPEPGRDETVRVVALDRSFHVSCYKCEDCGLALSSEAEGRGCYPLDDHVLCKSCNAERVQALTNRMTSEP